LPSAPMRASKIIGGLLAPSHQFAHEGIVVALTMILADGANGRVRRNLRTAICA
jgi:hypothetical protein